MILQALFNYYERRINDMPKMNMAIVNFMYAILIDSTGNFKGFEPLGNEDGLPLLTFRPEERTSAPIAHCMGDYGSYVLGLKDFKPDNSIDFNKEIKRNIKNHQAFINDVNDIFRSLPQNKYASAVHSFYQKYGEEMLSQMCENEYWPDLCKHLNENITFRIIGDTKLAACDEEIINYRIQNITNLNKEAICMITGEKKKPVSTTYSTFIIGGKSNAKLVSFQENSGYDSYGKKKGLNAPISEEAEFKYTTALLKMLSKTSRNKFQLGKHHTFLFWSSKNNDAGKKAEESFFALFGFNEQEDDPNKNIEQVRKVFEAIFKGTLKTTSEDTFYILGLAPNAARIAVTYWAEIPIRKFAETICKHFDDMEVADTRPEKKPYMSLRNMISAVTLEGKVSDATPNLADAVVKSIFEVFPYPQTLFTSCIRRIRAESSNENNSITTTRAAIIKAYLNRLNNNNKKITVMLDKDNTNQGYLCGRLFAVVERIQEISNRENDYFTNLRSNYINSASTTPSVVFPTILNLSVHHSDKLDRKDEIQFEKEKQDIIGKLIDFPNQLSLQDQGRFFIGYYHQRQVFFTKTEENNNEQ